MAEQDASSSISELESTIRNLPIIDNHAHNVYRPEGLKTGDLIAITSEASDDALEDAPTTLAHLRGAKMLKKLLDLPRSATWEEVEAKRAERLEKDSEAYLRTCFQETQTLLLDDKYDDDEAVENYRWHDQFTLSPCKRIERIEAVASDILEGMHEDDKLPTSEEDVTDSSLTEIAFMDFLALFDEAITASIADPEVVGFKSVICYETGLDIAVGEDSSQISEEVHQAFREEFLPQAVENEFAFETKVLNDFLVLRVCELLTIKACPKPFQFHTGLGSNNESILLSNPAYMQPIIDFYKTVNFVILHSAYPYTREAGYLASVYKNCYLDLGLVWPELSRKGQEKVIREAFEFTPWSKMLWSTDGHYLPETYYLSNVQGRLAMEKVMKEYVEEDDLTVEEAIQAVRAIYFENSNRLYGLGLELPVAKI